MRAAEVLEKHKLRTGSVASEADDALDVVKLSLATSNCIESNSIDACCACKPLRRFKAINDKALVFFGVVAGIERNFLCLSDKLRKLPLPRLRKSVLKCLIRGYAQSLEMAAMLHDGCKLKIP